MNWQIRSVIKFNFWTALRAGTGRLTIGNKPVIWTNIRSNSILMSNIRSNSILMWFQMLIWKIMLYFVLLAKIPRLSLIKIWIINFSDGFACILLVTHHINPFDSAFIFLVSPIIKLLECWFIVIEILNAVVFTAQ
jgi:hypothetical protein